ncbi:MAG: DUF4032 domain-containing protein [Chloroflexota bacterium]
MRWLSIDFTDLPWHLPLLEWEGYANRLEQVAQGLSRHPVVFANYSGVLYALKELPGDLARHEYEMLLHAEKLHLPVVTAVGYVRTHTHQGHNSVLVTRYLEGALPYRLLLMRQGFEPYRKHLLDAISGLLVQLHLAGVYWGDCSLSNTLFRRDAGALRAYLVDAETVELQTGQTPPMLRYHDLEIMEENINGELVDLRAAGVVSVEPGVPASDTGVYIRQRYRSLWEQVTREDVIPSNETYRIQERIRTLNEMGFSVGDVQLDPADNGSQLRLRVIVTDRNFHRDQLYNLTGLDAEEQQAQKIMNEIYEVRATLSRQNNRSTPLSVAAHHWLQQVYIPAVQLVEQQIGYLNTLPEAYCQILEHKWYMSERYQRDVGHYAAAEDYLQNVWQPTRTQLK